MPQQYKGNGMNIKPIKTESDYNATLAEIDQLMGFEADSPENDRLDVLAALVEAYEDEHYPIAPPDPIEAILHQMESQGLSRKDLEAYIGSRARVSEILNRKRSLSLKMIRKLQKGLGISADILIESYPLHQNSINKPQKSYSRKPY